MKNQTSYSSTQSKTFLLKRIGEEDIEINAEERMAILKALDSNTRFVQLRDYTLMLNSIKGIDPKPRSQNVSVRELEAPRMTDAEREQARNSLNRVREIFWTKRIKGGDDDE